MVMEVHRQFDEKPHLLDANPSERPDYDACIAISTKASLKEMIPPGAMVILTPLLTGIFFGVYACIAISTKASLKEMIPPGAMVILTHLLTGIFFGVYAVSG